MADLAWTPEDLLLLFRCYTRDPSDIPRAIENFSIKYPSWSGLYDSSKLLKNITPPTDTKLLDVCNALVIPLRKGNPPNLCLEHLISLGVAEHKIDKISANWSGYVPATAVQVLERIIADEEEEKVKQAECERKFLGAAAQHGWLVEADDGSGESWL